MMDNRVHMTDLLKQIAELKNENDKLKQLNKFSETPNTSKNDEEQHQEDNNSLPSTSKSTSIEAMALPSTSTMKYNNISTTTLSEIVATTDNSRKTYSEKRGKKAQKEKDRNQFSVYKKRAGTDDKGREYEYLMCAYYALKLCFDENVVDFEITANDNDYGDFDDVTLKVVFHDKLSHHFLLQMKYTEQMRGISNQMLSAEKGDFSLLKYIESFKNLQNVENLQGQDNISYILFTTRYSQLNDKSDFKLKGENIIVNQAPKNINHLLIDTISDDHGPHIFSFKQNGQNSQNFEDFFETFYLFTNQKPTIELHAHIDQLLYDRLGYKVKGAFIEFIRHWWKGNFILQKHDTIVKLAELALSPFIQEIPKDVNAPISVKAKLLKDAIMQFEMTFVKDHCDAHAVAKIWMEDVDLDMISKASFKYGFMPNGLKDTDALTSNEFTKLLWYLNKVPLIVKYKEKEEKRILAAIDLLEMETDKKKLILVGHKSKEAFPKWSIFESLYDLRTAPLYKEITAAFNISLYGFSIPLEKYIQSEEKAKDIIIKQLLLMSEENLHMNVQLSLSSADGSYQQQLDFSTFNNRLL